MYINMKYSVLHYQNGTTVCSSEFLSSIILPLSARVSESEDAIF